MEEEAVETPRTPTAPVSISLNSLMGLDTPRTMKFRGRVGSHEVLVMIDSGATHNFVSHSLVAQLDLMVDRSTLFSVTLGHGKTVQGKGLCSVVTLELGGVQFVEDFFVFDLGCADIILGMQWLETLGTVTTNWKLQLMTFKREGKPVMLQGDLSLGRSQLTLKAMFRSIRKERNGILIELNVVSGVSMSAVEPTVPVFLQLVLDTYATVFTDPVVLPPLRGHEHRIVLKEGVNPVSVRPYRYPQAQKDEIERLVKGRDH